MTCNQWVSCLMETVSTNILGCIYSNRSILQGTVDTNLGPDHLACRNTVDPNHFRQTTLWLQDNCTEFLIVHEMSCACFGRRHSPFPYYKCRVSDIAAVFTFSNVFCYEAVWYDNRTNHIWALRVTPHRRGFKLLISNHYILKRYKVYFSISLYSVNLTFIYKKIIYCRFESNFYFLVTIPPTLLIFCKYV